MGSNGRPGRAAVAKALSHPLRAAALQLLANREMSPNEIAAALEDKLPSVAYHVRMLHQLGCVELVRTQPRRGAVEHFYRATVRDARVEYTPV